jgi:16S rRNA processing protein RimM
VQSDTRRRPSAERPDPNREDEWVAIATLLRTRGIRGELSAVSLSSHPERFEQLGKVLLVGAEGFPKAPRLFEVEEVWEHGARQIFKFRGVDSISEAEQLRGAEVRIPESERVELPEDEFYYSDLVGCTVVEQSSGNTVGTVREFLEQGGNGLLKVLDAGRREILIPFNRVICVEVDIEAKRIEIDPPEGLLELNG